ncbi:MAG TPA: hypothetical protein VNI02_14990, partial [Blastocatellia bacterium]|nr:hypothetical protein [Blastocatellia bacterium]
TCVAFSPDGRFILTGSADSTTRMWNVSTGQELCRTYSFSDDTWVALDGEGRFDTNDLEGVRYLRWVMPDDPNNLLPLAIFARDCYEPRLLPRILSGEKFKPIGSLSELNLVQPPVRIVSLERQGQSDLVTVTVEVAKARSERHRDRAGRIRETDVFDLRLFRDGQIVGQFPREADLTASDGKGGPATPARAIAAEELTEWRKQRRVELDGDGKRRIKFENIRLPRSADVKKVEFSAYAFNEDRVKSKTDKKIFDIPQDLTPVKGRAYVITVGVNAYENKDFDLRFAALDARQVQKTLSERLSQNSEYQEVIQIPLISDYEMIDGQRIVTEKMATKQNIKTVFDQLSGKRVEVELLKDIPNADRIRQAGPEDLVLIFFSGQGYADAQRIFYIVPYDIGQQTEREITDTLSARSISSEELSLWLRDMDAGNMVMIVDMNQSEALIEGQGFKPGPMGNRGFGQLSYDKGMKILTATKNPKNIAIESRRIGNGLLTYTLIRDGIENGKAGPNDQPLTLKKWLEYAVERVPVLYQSIGGTGADIAQPALFDFAQKKRDVVLVQK